MTYRIFSLLLVMMMAVSCAQVSPPAPVGPLPTERQLAWQELEYYAFIHFNMNTFTNMEWGTGGERPEQFNPTEMDVRQWAKVIKEAGMKGVILTAKHHDGFCLWPTKTTEHSVKNSPWKDGQGDVVKELAAACAEFGIKFGVYLSPWDRNAGNYGGPEYVADFHEQLRELLTDYGEVFEVWFDGANGGSGYYGGANETRKIDSKTYYEWDKVTAMVRELQPNAVIFGDGGPDVRWVGTEEGFANETNWSIMRRDEIYPGWPRYVELRSGHADGTHWLPAEVNTSIRPGWYYHPGEDHQVKSLTRLVDTYYESVGRNGTFLLNLPVDTRGLVHETDVQQLMRLKKQLEADFKEELAQGTTAAATNVRGNGSAYRAQNAVDGKKDTYWATDDGVTNATLTLEFPEPTTINRVVLQEHIALGQRVAQFSIAAQVGEAWQPLDTQTTIGYKRILRFPSVKANAFRLEIKEAKGPPLISNLELYKAPNLLVPPTVQRDREGRVRLSVPDTAVHIRYTLDGSEPKATSPRYEAPFLVETPSVLKAIALDPESGEVTETVVKRLDIPKKDWKVVSVSSGNPEDSQKMLDEDANTFWATDNKRAGAQEVVIDLGQRHSLNGFTYVPNQERYPFGIVTDYVFEVSANGASWRRVAEGEFSNVVNSRLQQEVRFAATQARYIKLKTIKTAGDDPRATFAEIGVLTGG
ncbi:alpha-L-fucosidase [Maribacter sp. 2307ULW6-5]|uniref:alpha-L-fucosidase n=1 Tax=Maribacter sp. 2307ULW6-5 TaxID=3386275 RepID=UPI0039BD4B88